MKSGLKSAKTKFVILLAMFWASQGSASGACYNLYSNARLTIENEWSLVANIAWIAENFSSSPRAARVSIDQVATSLVEKINVSLRATSWATYENLALLVVQNPGSQQRRPTGKDLEGAFVAGFSIIRAEHDIYSFAGKVVSVDSTGMLVRGLNGKTGYVDFRTIAFLRHTPGSKNVLLDQNTDRILTQIPAQSSYSLMVNQTRRDAREAVTKLTKDFNQSIEQKNWTEIAKNEFGGSSLAVGDIIAVLLKPGPFHAESFAGIITGIPETTYNMGHWNLKIELLTPNGPREYELPMDSKQILRLLVLNR